jgi:uncharacterized protein (DUF488 family)
MNRKANELSSKPIIFTIGHSTRTLEAFLEILKEFHIQEVVDIRTIPRSRHNPQFNEEDIGKFLRKHHITYTHVKALGGLRHSHADSLNKGWHNLSFRGFADYMQTDEFEKALNELCEAARKRTIVIMCAEAVPWRCHRSLVGDALLVRQFQVDDIISLTSVRPHLMTSFAKIRGEKITYPAAE